MGYSKNYDQDETVLDIKRTLIIIVIRIFSLDIIVTLYDIFPYKPQIFCLFI